MFGTYIADEFLLSGTFSIGHYLQHAEPNHVAQEKDVGRSTLSSTEYHHRFYPFPPPAAWAMAGLVRDEPIALRHTPCFRVTSPSLCSIPLLGNNPDS